MPNARSPDNTTSCNQSTHQSKRRPERCPNVLRGRDSDYGSRPVRGGGRIEGVVAGSPNECLFREHPCNSCHRAGGRTGRKTARFRGNRCGTAVAYEKGVGLWFTAWVVNAGGSQAGSQGGVLAPHPEFFNGLVNSEPIAKFSTCWAHLRAPAVARTHNRGQSQQLSPRAGFQIDPYVSRRASRVCLHADQPGIQTQQLACVSAGV